TCTRTVSPALIGGRPASCAFSTRSIAPMSQLPQYLLLFFVQMRVSQEIRPPLQRSCERLALPPSPNRRVIPRQQHLGDAEVGDLRGPRELRKIEQSTAERVLSDRLLVADHAGNVARDGIEDNERRQLAAGQYVVANRDFFGDSLAHAFVESFIAAAQQHKMLHRAEPLSDRLRQSRPLRRR